MTLQMAKILHQMNNLTFKNAFHGEKVLKMSCFSELAGSFNFNFKTNRNLSFRPVNNLVIIYNDQQISKLSYKNSQVTTLVHTPVTLFR